MTTTQRKLARRRTESATIQKLKAQIRADRINWYILMFPSPEPSLYPSSREFRVNETCGLGPRECQVRGITGPSKERGSRIVAPVKGYAYKLARGRDLLTSWKEAWRTRGGARCKSP